MLAVVSLTRLKRLEMSGVWEPVVLPRLHAALGQWNS